MQTHSKWLGFAAILPTLAMTFIDQSVLAVALPTIQKHLNGSQLQLEWSINIYLLMTAILLLPGGKIGDRMGYRKTLVSGMILFVLASVLCGISPSMGVLITGRALQGIGAALMMPAFSVLMMSLFGAQERGKASGMMTSFSSIFLILGPLIGGYLTEAISWRWIFWINLPLAAIGLSLIFLFIPKSVPGHQKFDVLGFLLFAITSASLVTLITHLREWSFPSLNSILLLITFALGLYLLLKKEKKSSHPLLDFSLFRHPVYKAVNLSNFAVQFILMILVFRSLFFQDVEGWSPLKTGWVTVISSTPILFISPLGGYLSDRFGPKIPISVGFLLLIASCIWVGFFIHSPLTLLFPGLLAFGIGIPLILTPSFAAAMNSIPPSKAGVGFGTISTTRSLSSTLGVSAIGSLIAHIQHTIFGEKLRSNPVTDSLNSDYIQALSFSEPSALQSLKTFPASTQEAILQSLNQAETESLFYTHLWLAAALFIVFVCVFFLYHRKSSHHLPSSTAEGWD